MSSLNKRLSYLGLADFDYLSARLLLLCGIAHTGFPKAAEAFEKLFKLFLVLEAKITSDRELGPRDLKKYSHRLDKLFADVKSKVPVCFGDEWDEYFDMLQESYARRYPEHWKEFVMEVNIEKLDRAYAYFRSRIAGNLPIEESEKARQFGTFLHKAYGDGILAMIKRQGGWTPREILTTNNRHLEELGVDLERL